MFPCVIYLKWLLYKWDNKGLQIFLGLDAFPLIFRRWIRSPFFGYPSDFFTVACFTFFRGKMYFFELFLKFKILRNLFFFNENRRDRMKFLEVCKKFMEIGTMDPRISYLEAEKLNKFSDFFQIFLFSL